MFCAIRKFKNKKTSKGISKRLEVYTSKYENEPTKYCYTFSRDKFERPPRDSYQITIQHSYRENGKVQKMQWKVATINYYEFIDDYSTWEDYIPNEELDELLNDLNINLMQLRRMINVKLQPLLNEIKMDWEESEEYKITCEMREIIEKHNQAKLLFEEQWGEDTYDYIYDVFGNVRNKEYLDWVLRRTRRYSNEHSKTYSKQQTYDNKSHRKTKSNQEYPYTNIQKSPYSEDEKKWLKKFYRSLAKEFHPDVSGNNEAMVLINKLKKDWDV